MEIEDEQKLALLVGDDLVFLVRKADELMRLDHAAERDLRLVHDAVELAQLAITQLFVVHKVPLASTVVETKAVAFAREINPLRVAKLVTHEVEVGLAAETLRDQPDHLVKSHSARNFECYFVYLGHIRVDLGVEEPHGDSLITDDGLVMRLAVADDLLFITAISKTMGDVSHVPLLIRRLLQHLDPHVRHEHAETIIKAKATVLERATQSRHAGHIFGDRDSVRVDLTNQGVRET